MSENNRTSNCPNQALVHGHGRTKSAQARWESIIPLLFKFGKQIYSEHPLQSMRYVYADDTCDSSK